MSKKVAVLFIVFILFIPISSISNVSAEGIYFDLDSVPWAEEAIYFLDDRNIVNGYGNFLFGPNDNITREQAALMLVRDKYPNEISTTKLNFNDVQENSIYYNAIAVAVDHEILEGYPDSTFKPQDPITRAETAKILALAYDLEGKEANFKDLNDAPWAIEYIKALASNKIVIGYKDIYVTGYPDNAFKPNNSITRAEFSLAVARILDDRFKPKEPEDPLACGVTSNELVHIPDKNLEKAILEAIWPKKGDITVADMCGLTSLSSLPPRIFPDIAPIQDLTGIEHAKYLTNLYLDKNSIGDISALSGLSNLEILYLNNNSITDINALSSLTKLKWLYLDNNSISDISALSELISLEWIYLNNNSITDISALNRLTNLRYLELENNFISDISALSGTNILERLYIRNNSINDISALNELPYLSIIDLRENKLNVESQQEIEELNKRGVYVYY